MTRKLYRCTTCEDSLVRISDASGGFDEVPDTCPGCQEQTDWVRAD